MVLLLFLIYNGVKNIKKVILLASSKRQVVELSLVVSILEMKMVTLDIRQELFCLMENKQLLYRILLF